MARHKKDINIRLVAEQAGVSVATVSRVVNNRTDVSETVRRKVSEVIERFNFAPTKSVERRVNIGIVVALDGPLINDYITQILDGVAGYSDGGNLDVTVVLYRVCPEAKTLLQTIRERRCDAVVIVPPEPVADQLGDLRDAEIPTMLINGGLTGPKMGYIGNESYSGAVKAMEYLIACGHRRIGFLCNSLVNSNNHTQRLQAYKDVLARNGIAGDPAWIVPHGGRGVRSVPFAAETRARRDRGFLHQRRDGDGGDQGVLGGGAAGAGRYFGDRLRRPALRQVPASGSDYGAPAADRTRRRSGPLSR